MVVRRGEELFVEDFGSSNGTFVNRDRVTGQHTLVDGDIVTLGTLRAGSRAGGRGAPLSVGGPPSREADYTVGLIALPAGGLRLAPAVLAARRGALWRRLRCSPGPVPGHPSVVERYLLSRRAFQQARRPRPWLAGGSLLLWLLYAFYYVLHGWARRGGTPGLRLLGLRLADTGTRVPIGWVRTLLRPLGLLVSVLTLGIGFLLPAFRKDRALHDLVAGTRYCAGEPPGPRDTGKRRITSWARSFKRLGRPGRSPSGVLAILGVFSVASWTLIILKVQQLRRAQRGNHFFLADFRKATRLSEVQTAATKAPEAPVAGMFRAGYLELEAQSRVLQRQGGAVARSRASPPSSVRCSAPLASRAPSCSDTSRFSPPPRLRPRSSACSAPCGGS